MIYSNFLNESGGNLKPTYEGLKDNANQNNCPCRHHLKPTYEGLKLVRLRLKHKARYYIEGRWLWPINVRNVSLSNLTLYITRCSMVL